MCVWEALDSLYSVAFSSGKVEETKNEILKSIFSRFWLQWQTRKLKKKKLKLKTKTQQTKKHLRAFWKSFQFEKRFFFFNGWGLGWGGESLE